MPYEVTLGADPLKFEITLEKHIAKIIPQDYDLENELLAGVLSGTYSPQGLFLVGAQALLNEIGVTAFEEQYHKLKLLPNLDTPINPNGRWPNSAAENGELSAIHLISSGAFNFVFELKSKEVLHAWAEHSDLAIKRAIARNQVTSSMTLEKLAKHSDLEVRENVSCNRQTSADTLEELCQNKDLRYIIFNVGILSKSEGRLHNLQEKYLKDKDPDVRRAIARNITFKEGMEVLASDPDESVRGALLANVNLVLSLRAKMIRDPNEDVRMKARSQFNPLDLAILDLLGKFKKTKIQSCHEL